MADENQPHRKAHRNPHQRNPHRRNSAPAPREAKALHARDLRTQVREARVRPVRGPVREPRRRTGGAADGSFFRRKKVCKFCTEKIDAISYAMSALLQGFVAERARLFLAA